MGTSADISIHFYCNKSETGPIHRSKFSRQELADIRKCLALDLVYSPRETSNPRIIAVQILHDGITPVENELAGFTIEPNLDYPLTGYPSPILRFFLDRPIDEEEFRQSIFETTYLLKTALMKKSGEEPRFMEDFNGYAELLEDHRRDELVTLLRRRNAYCGKTFRFPSGLPENGFLIP
jgi:hypothetical protein